MAKRRTTPEGDTLELGGDAGASDLGGGLAVDCSDIPAARHNAELQFATDVAGTWLLLIAEDGTPIPLTLFGPDRAAFRDRVLAVIHRAG